MSYIIILECDNEACDKKTTVPQVGAMPMSWIAVRQVTQSIDRQSMDVKDGAITKTYCSQKCLVEDMSNGPA